MAVQKIGTEEYRRMKAEQLQAVLLKIKENGTQKERARAKAGLSLLANNQSDGIFGLLAELNSATKHSNKKYVSTQGKPDTFIKWENESGKIVSRPAEVKTNGGRVSSLIERLAKGKDTLCIYSMDMCNANTANVPRILEPIVIPFSLFFLILNECNALKNTNGVQPELAIQASSKRLYERLLDYPIPYEPNTVYCEDDFEGLEV